MSLNKKLYRKILAAATALTMAFAATGCGESTSWIAKYQDETVNSGIYIFYQTEAYNDATSLLLRENSEFDVSDTKLLKTMPVEGKNITDWINDKAMEKLKIYTAINQKFDELGLELTEDDKSGAQYMAEYYWQYYSETYEQNGIGKDSFIKLVEFDSKKEKVFLYYYGEGGEKECPDNEITSYLEGNYSRVKTIKFDLSDTEGDETAEAKNLVVKTLAEDYKKRANSGEDFDKLIKEYNAYLEKQDAEESEAEEDTDSAEAEEDAAVTTAAEKAEEPEITEAEEGSEEAEAVTTAETEETEADDEASEDEESEESEEDEEEPAETEEAAEDNDTAVTTAAEDSEEPAVTEEKEEDEDTSEEAEEEEDPYANETVYKKGSEENGYNPSEKVNKAVFNDCEIGGEAVLVEDEDNNCIYLIKRLDVTQREDYFEGDRKNSILSEMFNDEFENTAVKWADDYGISYNTAAIKRYDPFNIKF